MNRLQPYPLWIGHIGDARDLSLLYEHGVEVVVQLAIEEPVVATARDLVLLRVPLYDGTGNSAANLRLAVQVVSELIRERRPTLVSCSAGMSRSPVIVAVALARVEHREAVECLEEVRRAVPVDVSPGFWGEVVRVFSKG